MSQITATEVVNTHRMMEYIMILGMRNVEGMALWLIGKQNLVLYVAVGLGEGVVHASCENLLTCEAATKNVHDV